VTPLLYRRSPWRLVRAQYSGGDASSTAWATADAERFIDEARGDDPELAKPLRIEERKLDTRGLGVEIH
jgi:hypothetical protein